MPSQGHNYTPYPPSTVGATTSTSAASSSPAIVDQSQFYPYYAANSSYSNQYYQQYQGFYSQSYPYYQQPMQSTNYAQAYLDAAYSAAYPQIMPQGPQPLNNIHASNQKSSANSWKKNHNRLPVAYCNDCSRPFYSNAEYENHLKCHVNCPDCGLSLTKKQLVSHRNEAHPKLVTIEDPKEIANYIAERKGKYPKSGKLEAKIVANDGEGDQDKSLSWKNPDQDSNAQGNMKKRKLVVAVGYCKFFPLGKCKKGAGCPYYHELPGDQEKDKATLLDAAAASTTSNLAQTSGLVKSSKSKKKRKITKLKTHDRSKLLQLLNEEFMEKEDSILLQVIRYFMDNKS